MKRFSLRYAVLAAMLFASSLLASAQSAGYDLLQTGSGASVDLSSVPGVSPSTVPLQGVPICTCIGNTDTIMQRTQAVPTGGGVVDVDLYALSMKNSGNVTFNGQPVDVHVIINNTKGDIANSALAQLDTLQPSGGTLNVRTNGTFDSNINVNADIIFTTVGGNPANPSQVLAHQAAPEINLSSTNSTWSSTPSPGYPSAPCYPSGGFYPKPVHTGPHPVVPPAPSPTPTPSPSPTPTPSPSPTPIASPTPIHSLNGSSSSLTVPQFHEESIFVWKTNTMAAHTGSTGRSGYDQKRAAALLSASALAPAARVPRTCVARTQQPARPVPIADADRSKPRVIVNRDWIPAVVTP